jgi:hypothetical protein
MATTLIIEARGPAKSYATGAQRVEALRGSHFAVQQQGKMVAIRAPPAAARPPCSRGSGSWTTSTTAPGVSPGVVNQVRAWKHKVEGGSTCRA